MKLLQELLKLNEQTSAVAYVKLKFDWSASYDSADFEDSGLNDGEAPDDEEGSSFFYIPCTSSENAKLLAKELLHNHDVQNVLNDMFNQAQSETGEGLNYALYKSIDYGNDCEMRFNADFTNVTVVVNPESDPGNRDKEFILSYIADDIEDFIEAIAGEDWGDSADLYANGVDKSWVVQPK